MQMPTNAKVAIRAWARLAILTVLCLLALSSHVQSSAHALDVAQLLDAQRITRVRLSPDGRHIAYSSARVGGQWTVSWGGTTAQVAIRSVADGAEFATMELAGTTDYQWAPTSDSLIFTRRTETGSELWRFNITSRESVRLAVVPGAIDLFRVNSAGDIAITSRAITESLFNALREEPHGVEVDVMRMSIYDLIDPSSGTFESAPAKLYVLAYGQTRPSEVVVPGSVRAIHWAPDNSRLSVVFVRNGDQEGMFEAAHTSIGVVAVNSGRLRVVARFAQSERTYYEGGEWTPDGSRLLVRRVHQDPLQSHYQQYSFVRADRATVGREDWFDIESYPLDQQFVVLDSASFLYANTKSGVHTLSLRSRGEVRESAIPLPASGQNSQFSFSRDRAAVAFVNQSVDRPAEIFYVAHGDEQVRQITNLNGPILQRGLGFTGRSIWWSSRDGHRVQGWLLSPDPAPRGPVPLLTFVHGGPTAAHRNEFAYTLEAWPYPLESLAAAGIAVFIPNYRGTATFGIDHERVDSIDGQPVQDILSGIDELVRLGVADPQRLALAGHSHGGWLGPMVWTESNRFAAVSFAEGWSNWPVIYEAMPARHNIDVHDTMIGTSYYDNPTRYNELSPDLRMSQVTGAALFEAGAQNGPLFMFGMAKAARRRGLNTTFIVYPNTGHTVEQEEMRRESATRNFRFFMDTLTPPAN